MDIQKSGGGDVQTKVVKWGNSQGIRLPKLLLDSANLSGDDLVEVTAGDGCIVIRKARAAKPYKSIQERFAGFDGSYEPAETDWGDPAGNEIW